MGEMRCFLLHSLQPSTSFLPKQEREAEWESIQGTQDMLGSAQLCHTQGKSPVDRVWPPTASAEPCHGCA